MDCGLADHLFGWLANRGSRTARSAVVGPGVSKSSGAAALWPLKGLRDKPLAPFQATAAREVEEAVINEQVKPESALRR